jgi:hypothetical protein
MQATKLGVLGIDNFNKSVLGTMGLNRVKEED